MRERIQQFEHEARKLEPARAERRAWLEQAGEYAQTFLDALPAAPVYRPDDGRAAAFEAGIREQPAALADLLEVLASQVDHAGINPASGGHLGYIPGGGVFPAAIGDFLADVSNRFSGVAYASPGAARMEQSLVRWMADLVGFGESAGGDLTSGGSLANLSAIVTAREALNIRATDVPTACIYSTRQAHHCIDKALRVAGLDEACRRYVPMDDRYRMSAVELAGLIQSDVDRGLRPFMVVGSAGTTDTGAVDPLTDIARIARQHGLWFHLDAAYGGFFALCEEGKAALQGIGLADSIVMDPHKGLFLPYGSGAVLVRDVELLARAHRFDADYMQDTRSHRGDYSPADLSAELSRPFRGLRLWLPLRLFGLQPFRAALAEKIWLARYFHRRIGALPGWEVGPEPDLSVVTYRYKPQRGDPDAINQRLVKAVHADGRVFVTSTQLDGRYTLRFAALNFRTHLEHVDYLLGLLERLAPALEAA